MFPIHGKFPKLMPIIGRMLLDYGELEIDLMNAVQIVCGYDLNRTLKAMFKDRGEQKRLKIADGLGRPAYDKLGLGDEFASMMDAFDHCRLIRNKYAHAQWHDPDFGKTLVYVSVEELADEPERIKDLAHLVFYYLDESLLIQQECYFEYIRELINFLNHEAQKRLGVMPYHSFTLPVPMEKPPFFTKSGVLPFAY